MQVMSIVICKRKVHIPRQQPCCTSKQCWAKFQHWFLCKLLVGSLLHFTRPIVNNPFFLRARNMSPAFCSYIPSFDNSNSSQLTAHWIQRCLAFPLRPTLELHFHTSISQQYYTPTSRSSCRNHFTQASYL